ncbi:sigma-54-dependent Fis family transcriptional regulator [Frigoriglobus tundricola]|uniref:Sigma-54 factor interaction domain-containing protein n=1 Tax=Frigoriglobus tundricola TaxID=2774151 RepID=A0A6M5Z4V8_9BACT|nr:sigma-54-dependent Fis family transcriptional regulator [Frigoriglobus tundricola]QJX01269.1 hypothetical protein FTUN_8909 [Frigoriglobus tundricola]
MSKVDLAALVEDGRFRRDLYHRLNEFKVVLPPLRDRGDEMPGLAGQFVPAACAELGRAVRGFSPEALDKLRGHRWPGNIRELRNVVRRAVLLADDVIDPDHLEIEGLPWEPPVPDGARAAAVSLSGGVSLKSLVRKKVADTEREVAAEALRMSGGNKTRAARLLRVDCKSLRSKAREYDLDHTLDHTLEDADEQG